MALPPRSPCLWSFKSCQCSLPFSNKISAPLLCNWCSMNKSHKHSFGENTISSSKPLEIIYSDVWTSPLFSFDGYKYYLVLIDHFTRYTWLYPLKRKSQVFEVFTRFKALVENRFQTRIVTFYSDNGSEFLALTLFLSKHGISHYCPSMAFRTELHLHIILNIMASLSENTDILWKRACPF